MAFPPGFLDELRARTTLSDVVGRKVTLKRAGREFSGLCPFHKEKTPSFTVNDRKGFFHCFGCGEHGDAIGFVMKTEGLSFPESVEKLAREVGLEVPRATPQERERAERASSLQEVVELAARWFERQLRLPVGRAGLDYLRGRGLSEETIEGFRLGFAPDSRDGLLATLKREGATEDRIVEAGLAIRPDDGRGAYDRFRGRVMFPINDRRGRVIAFGGRVIGPGEPKYLNSPETPLFHKGNNLYCLDRARAASARDQPVIVAEGYMDVIALQVAGFAGAVAPLGTALTEAQLQETWKLADEPVLSFDGDNAGRRAASRAAERALPLLRPGKSLRFALLPQGEDPDSLIRNRGAAAISGLLERARPLADIVWEMETEGRPTDTPERRARLQHAIERRVEEIADLTVRDYYRTDMRDRLARLRAATRPAWTPGARRTAPGWRGQPPPGPFAPGAAARRVAVDSATHLQERALLGALVERPALLHRLAEDLAALPIDHADLSRLRASLLDAAASLGSGLDPAIEDGRGDEPPLETSLVLDHLAREGLARLASTVAEQARAQFRDTLADTDLAVEQWRRMARHIAQLSGDPEELARAEQALADDPSEENLGRLQAVLERIRRERADIGP